MVYGFFVWWYGAGFYQSWQVALYWLSCVEGFFSIQTLLTTWFLPWKNDVLVARNLSIGDQVNLWMQNLVSRLVGAVVRSVFITVGLSSLAVVALLLATGLIIWLLTPLLIFGLPILAAKIAYYG